MISMQAIFEYQSVHACMLCYWAISKVTTPCHKESGLATSEKSFCNRAWSVDLRTICVVTQRNLLGMHWNEKMKNVFERAMIIQYCTMKKLQPTRAVEVEANQTKSSSSWVSKSPLPWRYATSPLNAWLQQHATDLLQLGNHPAPFASYRYTWTELELGKHENWKWNCTLKSHEGTNADYENRSAAIIFLQSFISFYVLTRINHTPARTSLSLFNQYPAHTMFSRNRTIEPGSWMIAAQGPFLWWCEAHLLVSAKHHAPGKYTGFEDVQMNHNMHQHNYVTYRMAAYWYLYVIASERPQVQYAGFYQANTSPT